MNTQKPRALPGTMCPLWRKDVSKVCHTCELWDTIRVRNSETKEVYDHWGCTYRLHTILLRDIGLGQNGVQHAVESHRNEDIKRKDLALDLMVAVQEQAGTIPVLPMRRESKQINGPSAEPQ